MMRTTITLPDDVHRAATSLATLKRISLGDAIAELVRKGLEGKGAFRQDTAFPTFDIPRDAEPITLEQTLAAEEEW